MGDAARRADGTGRIYVYLRISLSLSVTALAQTAFPYQANGSVIEVTFADGSNRIYGSELIGQNYESAEYFFGRVNTGAPTNLSPESEEYRTLLKERIDERKKKLIAIGYEDTEDIPDELLTSGGSGVDPHISPDAAFFQIPAVLKGRIAGGWKLVYDESGHFVRTLSPEDREKYDAAEGETVEDYTEDYLRAVIEKYTEGRFLGLFGENRVTVLLVNLALDGRL